MLPSARRAGLREATDRAGPDRAWRLAPGGALPGDGAGQAGPHAVVDWVGAYADSPRSARARSSSQYRMSLVTFPALTWNRSAPFAAICPISRPLAFAIPL